MKAKNIVWLFLLLIWGNSGIEQAKCQTVIDKFPYEMKQDGWILGKRFEWMSFTTFNPGCGFEYKYSDTPSVFTSSPFLELSSLKQPEITFVGEGFEMRDDNGDILYSQKEKKIVTLLLDKKIRRLTFHSIMGYSLLVKNIVIGEKNTTSGKTVINKFPFTLKPFDKDWELKNGTWGTSPFVESTKNALLTSPRIELPNMGGSLIVEGIGMHVFTSTDGESFIPLSTIGEYSYGVHELPLQSDVKYIRIEVFLGKLVNLAINGFSRDISWNIGDKSATLTGTTVSAGATVDCWFPDIVMKNIYYLKRYKAAFSVSNPDPDNVQLYFIEKPANGVAHEIPVNETNGRIIINLTPVNRETVVSLGFKAVMKRDGNVSMVKISNFYVGLPFDKIDLDLTRWYDENRDGDMEFFYSLDEKMSGLDKRVTEKYEIKNGLVVKYGDIPETENMHILYPYNINNDDVMDYYGAFQKGASDNLYYDYKAYTNNGKQATKISQEFYRTLVPCDYNSDGLSDFLLEKNQVAVQLVDGTFMIRQLEVLTQKEYQNKGKNDGWNQYIPSHIVTSTFDDAFLSGDDMFIGGSSAYKGSMGYQATDLDFNKDGRPDLLNTSTGQLLLNIAEDKYVSLPLGGTLYFRDLNGDQCLDYLVYEPTTKTVSSHVLQTDGTEKVQVLVSNLSMDQQVWCYDFDKDDDVDVLLPFSYLDTNGASFLVVMENDGTGKFKKHESVFDEQFKFVDCVDIDHDGYYDVVVENSIPRSEALPEQCNVYLLKGDAKMKFILQPEPLTKISAESNREYSGVFGTRVADINNDGVYEILMTGFDSPAISYLSGVTPNKAPQRPEKPIYLFEPATGYLKVSWKLGEDIESSPVDLTYALRIGTEPGKGNVYYAHAMEDGTRLNLLEGNMGYNLEKLLNASGWSAGKYYIAVQVVDPMHKGSAWSEEAIFDKDQLTASFHISDQRTVDDTLTVALTNPTDVSLQYKWDWGGAEVISVNAEKTIYNIRFLTAGDKYVSLQTIDGKGNASAVVSKKLFVFANRFMTENFPASPGFQSLCKAMDMDNDGVLELLTDNGVYERNEKGEYVKIKKIYNTNLSFDNQYSGTNIIADVNKDGLADELYYQTEFGPVYTLKQHINVGDKELSIENIPDKNEYIPQGTIVDFNNDGYFDFVSDVSYPIGTSPMFNTGNNLTFEKFDLGPWMSMGIICDLNNDGFMDGIEGMDSDSESSEAFIRLFLNNGDKTFTEKRVPITHFTEYTKINAVADMNNDGYPDLIIQKNETTILIALNHKNENFDEIKEITVPVAHKNMIFRNIVDFDNNGYLDILVEGNGESSFIYFYDDFEYEVQGLKERTIETEVGLDLDNDGDLDYLEYDGYYGKLNGEMNHTTVTNTRPEAPQNIHASQQDNFIVLQWDAAKDLETPYAQIRYNISVKKQGVQGEGAYIISSMNDLKADAAIVPDQIYPTATTYSIPLAVMPAGTYEVNVQAIDGWKATSPFSESYILKVEASPKIQIPTAVCVGKSASINYKGNTGNATLAWNWDGGQVLTNGKNTYEVVWNTGGTKQISVTSDGVTSTVSLFVSPAINMDFMIHPFVLVGAENKLTLLEDNYSYTWTYSKDGADFRPVSGISNDPFEPFYSHVKITRHGNINEAKIVFGSEGEYILRLNAETSCGVLEFDKQISVSGQLQKQEIKFVTADADAGKYRISWSLPSDLPTFANGINIYKEGSRYNDFRLLATVPVTESGYVDLASNPQITSSRYRLTLLTSYGSETTSGTPHKGVHVMLNKGMGNSWNLIWSQYEGAIVDSYRILRGTTPDNMTVIGEVSGSATSYSDMNAPEGMLYYALGFDTGYDGNRIPLQAQVTRASSTSARSNVISVANASDVLFAEDVHIRSSEEEMELSKEQTILHLSANIYPLLATFRTINWFVTSGDDIARIDQNGVLTALGNKNGTVTVRAATIDGSGVFTEIQIPVSDLAVGVEEDAVGAAELIVYPSPVSDRLFIKGISLHEGKAQLSILNLNGQSMLMKEIKTEEMEVSCAAYPAGIYLLKLVADDKVMTQRFMKK